MSFMTLPHHSMEVSRKAALSLEGLSRDPRNRVKMLQYEAQIANIAMGDSRLSDVAAKILFDLTSDVSAQRAPVQSVWSNL
jgi:hypothetical protein